MPNLIKHFCCYSFILSLTACTLAVQPDREEKPAEKPAAKISTKKEISATLKITTPVKENKKQIAALSPEKVPVKVNLNNNKKPEINSAEVKAVSATPAILENKAKVDIVAEPEFHDAWWEIKQGQMLPNKINNKVRMHISWFSKHQDYLDRVARRAQPYLYFIIEELKKENMPLELALLPIVESGYQPFAYSHGRAAGMWQFIPSTAKLYGLKQNWWYDGRRDPVESTKAAIKLLKRLAKRYNGDWLLALAAYNSGTGNISKAIKYNKKRGRGTSFWDLKLPKETENYVPKLLALKALINNPEKYGISWYPVPYEKHIEVVDAETQIDLALVADLAKLPIETIYRYNSGYNRWSTPPKGPHNIVLPKESAKVFAENLKKTPKHQRITWKRHKIKKGETLSALAYKYHTTIKQLETLNNIRNKTIRAGKYIIVPVSGKNIHRYTLSAQQRLNIIKSTKRSGHKYTFRVQKGDTFWDLARKYKVTVKKLAKWNGMAPGDKLKVGQKLVVWTKDPNISIRSALLGNRYYHSKETSRTINYSVRRGDSLARIANKFNVRIHDLKKWNAQVRHLKYIQPGQKLKLIIDVRQQSGQS